MRPCDARNDIYDLRYDLKLYNSTIKTIYYHPK